ncbi:hypothetical protein DEU32_10831 [Curtobacterium sp. AG1037]|uniref:hypothetical protein n=1 Tax=Curtobacterium sp. AG1037 TaxID=2183990 RepID=UPI000E2BAD02|nr:hypothetical protein [Curtobacterium sp. AG1037]RDH96866.1 hypothetical protein DEU32_10831 [Curtobacterium sp. AG1037]
MERVCAEVFVVRRDGRLVAEPTGGVARRAEDAPPQTWFAIIDDEAAEPLHSGCDRVSAEIELLSPVPESGMLGRVVRLSPASRPSGPSVAVPPSRRDDAMDLLELVPDRWQPYEVRAGELRPNMWEVFVGTLFPVSVGELDAVLGRGWERLVRVEPWLVPRAAPGLEEGVG